MTCFSYCMYVVHVYYYVDAAQAAEAHARNYVTVTGAGGSLYSYSVIQASEEVGVALVITIQSGAVITVVH